MSLIIYTIQLCYLFLSTNKNSGCGAVRLAYTSGGRVVAGADEAKLISMLTCEASSAFEYSHPDFR